MQFVCIVAIVMASPRRAETTSVFFIEWDFPQLLFVKEKGASPQIVNGSFKKGSKSIHVLQFAAKLLAALYHAITVYHCCCTN